MNVNVKPKPAAKPIKKAVYALEHHAKHMSPVAGYFGLLAWEAGWEPPKSSRNGANSFYTRNPKGQKILIRYRGVGLELIHNGVIVARFRTKLDVIKYFLKGNP